MPSHVKAVRRAVPAMITVRAATQRPSAPAPSVNTSLFTAVTAHGINSKADTDVKGNVKKNLDQEMLEKVMAAKLPEEEDLSWTEFAENSTFHGIKYIFQPGFMLRRVLWLLVVIGAIILFVCQVGSRTNDFFKWSTNVDVKFSYTPTLKFPAVTICNQNNFRTTKMVDNGLYYFIDEIYSATGSSDVNFTSYEFAEMDSVRFLQDVGHQFEDLVDQCVWKGEVCDRDDFKIRFTDVGVCFTFNSKKSKPLKVKQPGSAYGLSLILNVEQYEYMKGPNNDAGVKILLHDQTEFPLMQDKGFAVAPGTHTIVTVDKGEVQSLGPPYGECDPDMERSETRSDCIRKCRTKQMRSECGCMDAYMDNSTVNTRVCDVPVIFGCVKTAKEQGVLSDSDCGCGVPCFHHTYDATLSYAQLSQFNIERLVLVDPVKRARAEENFLLATEYAQRVVVDIALADEYQLEEMMSLIVELDDMVNSVYDRFNSIEAFQANHNSPIPLFNREEVYDPEFELIADIRNNLYYFTWYFPGWYSSSGAFGSEVVQERMRWFFESGTIMEERLQDCHSNVTSRAFDPGFDPLRHYADTQGVWIEYDYDTFYEFPDSYHYYLGNCHYYMDPDQYRGWWPMIYEVLYSCYQEIDVCDVYVATKLRHAVNIQSMLSPNSNGTGDMAATAEQLRSNYIWVIDEIFDGTYANASDRPEHFQCLQALDDFAASTTFPTEDVMNLLDNIISTTNYNDFLTATTELEDFMANIGSVIDEDAVIEQCKWYQNYLGWTEADGTCYNSDWDVDMDCDQYTDYQEGLTDAERYANAVQFLFTNMASNLLSMKTTSNQKLRGRLFTAIEDYLEMNITKTQLAEIVQSYVIKDALQAIASRGDDFISASMESIQQTQIIQGLLEAAYIDLYTLTMPVMSPEVTQNMTFFEYYSNANNTNITAILSHFHDDPEVGLQALFEEVYAGYYRELENAREDLDGLLDQIAVAGERLEEMLIDYALSTRMNYNFYTKNFLQVDIFYKELSYERIEQQPAFVFLSLLSEVGGFMGLLLGASILTVCELCDYIVLTVSRKCNKNKEREQQDGEQGDGLPEVQS